MTSFEVAINVKYMPLVLNYYFFSVKSAHMLLTSVPNWIIGMCIIKGLEIHEPKFIISTVFSAVSVIYGFGEFLATNANNGESDYPWSKNFWVMLTILVDCTLRGCFLAYTMTIIKAKVLFIPLVYGILSIIAILIKKRSESGLMKLHVEDVIGTMISFVTSGYETKFVNYTFRLMSKCIFSGIMIVTSIIVGITQLPKLETSLGYDLSYCQSICPEDKDTNETDAGNKV